MKGRYNGSHMTIYGSILPGADTIARSVNSGSIMTEQAKHRLKILDWWRNHGQNYSLTARHFGYGRMTIYRWVRRCRQFGLSGLNEDSRKPKNVRRPTTSRQITGRIVQLREEYPAWSKYKLRVLLKREGYVISTSTVGRILKRKGLINEKVSRKRSKAALCPKARFPKGMKITAPGQMIQMDTKHVMLVGGRKFFQFTAIDVLTKRKVMRVYPSESSRNGAHFIDECLNSFPYPILAVQTDNGAPFLKEFNRRCEELQLPHYFIYPRTPKQNTYVEISHGADEREFYQQGNVSQDLENMRASIKRWEYIWNQIRPHEALNQLTPNEYLNYLKTHPIPTRDTIILQT